MNRNIRRTPDQNLKSGGAGDQRTLPQRRRDIVIAVAMNAAMTGEGAIGAARAGPDITEIAAGRGGDMDGVKIDQAGAASDTVGIVAGGAGRAIVDNVRGVSLETLIA